MAGRITGFLFLAIALLLLLRGLYEPHVLKVTFTRLGSGRRHIRVLLLSDLHAGFFFIRLLRLEAVLRTEGLDAVLFAGDLVNGSRDLVKGLRILSDLARTASNLGLPLYTVSGNHDPADLASLLPSTGAVHLSNRCVLLTAADGSLWRLTGLDDHRTGTPSYAAALRTCPVPSSPSASPVIFPDALADTRSEPLPEIILAHNPETIFSILADRSVPTARPAPGENTSLSAHTTSRPQTFLLSGHFHGGQIWMPFGIEYRLMRRETMSRQGFRKGSYEKDGILGYISRGLGCVLVPLRFLSFPEAAVLDLYSDEPSRP